MQLTSSRISSSFSTIHRDRIFACSFFCFAFLAGSVLGSILGLPFSGAEPLLDGYIFSNANATGLFIAFVWFIRFQFISFLMGTSFLGVTLIPLLVFLRGYILSCASATIINSYPQNGIIMALIIVGIPSILSIPCFFLISTEAFFSSRRLLRMCSGGFFRGRIRFKSLIVCIPVLFLGTLAEAELVPYIISRFIR